MTPIPTAISDPLETIQALREQIAARPAASAPSARSSGCLALDGMLPDGGLRPGTLVEWIAATRGSGATTLACLAAREACRDGKTLVVLDRHQRFYAPAAIALGIDLNHLVIVRPRRAADEEWAADQALRCAGVGAVLGWPEKLQDRSFRRLQLAAEAGNTLGLLVRSAAAKSEPSWAELRILVTPVADPTSSTGGIPAAPTSPGTRHWQITLLRARGIPATGQTQALLWTT